MILYFLDKSLTNSNGKRKSRREKRQWRIELGDEEEAEGVDGDTGVNTNVKSNQISFKTSCCFRLQFSIL